MAIDWEAFKSGKRPVKTRHGLSARYGVRIDHKSHPHVVIIDNEPCGEYAHMYDDDGKEMNHFGLDITSQEEEVIEIVDYYNVYRRNLDGGYVSKTVALENAGFTCIATVKVTTRIQGNKVTITGGTDGR